EVTQRARKVATLLKVKCERGRYFGGAAGIGLLQPLAQALVRLCAAPGRKILVNDVLIENVTEGVGARICAIGPLGNPRTNEDLILPDRRFDVPFNVDRIVGQAGRNEGRRKFLAGNAGDIEQTPLVVGEAIELV